MSVLRKVLSTYAEATRAIETGPMRVTVSLLSVSRHPSEALAALLHSYARRARQVLLRPAVGREDAIKVVGCALDERRLVSITEPGGIGKTTVAIATAAR
jgi:ATP-dependent Clp protease ATP-binding subunit ClpA